MIDLALSKLGVDDYSLCGPAVDEQTFNAVFRKIIGMTEDGSALLSTDPDVFGVTWEQVRDKVAELRAAEPLRLLREERNRRLVDEVDVRTMPYHNQNLAVPQALVDHRQALCDLPATASPTLDENGQLAGVDWPTPPDSL